MSSAEKGTGVQHDPPLCWKRKGCEVDRTHPVRGQKTIGSACQREREAQQGSIDLLGPLKDLAVDREIDQRVERANGADVARLGSLDAQVLGLAVDAFAGRTLAVDALVERTLAIKRHAHQATSFQVEVFDTAFVLAKLLMVTGLACALRIEQRTAIALRPEAIGMPELVSGMHAQALRASRSAIGVAWHLVVGMLVERDGGNASTRCAGLVGVPAVEGSISGDMDGKGSEHGDGLDVEWHKIGDIVFIEG
jgi:hypothetical protein